jgi:hypothetical protein
LPIFSHFSRLPVYFAIAFAADAEPDADYVFDISTLLTRLFIFFRYEPPLIGYFRH